jgi:hypothetical protein
MVGALVLPPVNIEDIAMTDKELLQHIQALLSGVDWDSDTLMKVAELMSYNGYHIAPPDVDSGAEMPS